LEFIGCITYGDSSDPEKIHQTGIEIIISLNAKIWRGAIPINHNGNEIAAEDLRAMPIYTHELN